MTGDADPQATVSDLLDGSWRAQIVGAFVRLGCPDALTDRALSVLELARLTGAQPAPLQRLLRAAEALGLCGCSDDVVTLTAAGALLVSTNPQSVQAWAVLCTDSWLTRAWELLAHAVRTGDAAFVEAHGEDFWHYVRSHPDQAAFFDQAMTSGAAARAEIVAAHIDLARVGAVVDVGGGKGELLARLLSAQSHLTGIVVERPEVIAGAERSLDPSVRGRLRFHAASFFTDVPRGADLYILSRILHDWNDDRALDVLRTCRHSMDPGARVCVLESVLPDHQTIRPEDAIEAAVKDLNMLVLVGGQERTSAEYEGLLVAAGFDDVNCILTGAAADVIVATAA